MENQSVLTKYKRQPKIYLTLPTKGKWYKDNPMEKTGSGELPIYSMTAKDELAMKTPDALMNGEATVATIKSCCPMISDPWQMPILDVDAVLVAIRIATYGEKMEMQIPIPGLKEATTENIEVDLRTVLDSLQNKTWVDVVEHEDLKFHLRPLTYKQSTDLFQDTYENARMASIMQDPKISDKDKLEAFKAGFKKLSQQTLNTVLAHVVAIETPEGTEENKSAIKEFFDNTDKETFQAVSDHLEAQRAVWTAKPQNFKTPQEYVDQGAPEEIEVPMIFDQSNFFVSK
jgi:hypothetical protein